MAARAGIEPGQPRWLSSGTTVRVEGYERQYFNRSRTLSVPSSELFTGYAPHLLITAADRSLLLLAPH
jgi:hypothetical protein